MFRYQGGTGRLHDEQNFLNGAKIGRVWEFGSLGLQGTGCRVQVISASSFQPSAIS
jgi:hypothetical protein